MIDFTSRSWLFHLTFWSWLFFDFLLIKCWLLADFFWLFFTSRSHEKVRWCLLKVTESQKKSKKSSRKSQKYDMFFDIIWQVLLSFRKTKKIYKYKTFYRFSSVAYSNYKETLQLILATYMNTWHFLDFLELFWNVIFYF